MADIPSFRIGQGYDVHAFGAGDHVMLGGVRVPHGRGVVAHSDGDVALHALCDAILGALALGDIGVHFPPSDERWRDADSLALLRRCVALAGERGYPTLINDTLRRAVAGERLEADLRAIIREELHAG